MWPANLFYLTIACCWLMACFAIRRPPWETGAVAQSAYRRSLVAYCCWCTFFIPPVYGTVDRVMRIPNGTRLVLAVTAIAGAYMTQPWLRWFVPPGARGESESPRAHGRRGFAILDSPELLVIVLAGTVTSFFLVHRPSGVASEPLNGAFLVAYGRDRWLLAFLFLTHSYVGGVYLRLIHAYLPVIRSSLHRFPEPVARYRFQSSVYITMLGLLYNLHELARALLYYAGLPAHPASHSATACLVLALYNVAELWCFYGSFRWLAHYLAHRQLGPIWWALYQAIPTIAHRAPWLRLTDGLWLGPRAVGNRLRSRIYAIWDGISTLYPYRSATLAQQARAACAAAGLPDEEVVPVVEAVLLKAGIAARDRNEPPVLTRAALPELSQESFGEQIAFLQRVAWAWARSPIVEAVLAANTSAEGGPVRGEIAATDRLPEYQELLHDRANDV